MEIAEQLGNKDLLSALKRHTPPSGTGSVSLLKLIYVFGTFK